MSASFFVAKASYCFYTPFQLAHSLRPSNMSLEEHPLAKFEAGFEILAAQLGKGGCR